MPYLGEDIEDIRTRKESGFYAFPVVTTRDADRWNKTTGVEYPVSGDATKVVSSLLPSFTGILWSGN